jgi:hypothetical protein
LPMPDLFASLSIVGAFALLGLLVVGFSKL